MKIQKIVNITRLIMLLLLYPSLASCTTPKVNSDCPSSSVTLTVYYGSEKQAWFDDVLPSFKQVCSGLIKINATPLGSGQAMNQILDCSTKPKPDVWIPADAIWLTMANEKWLAQPPCDNTHKQYQLFGTLITDNPSLVTSPLVIAMWESEAKAMGWPNPLGWQDIEELSRDPQGWKRYGLPDGKFKFAHTKPGDSNSGLDAILAENYAAVGFPGSLTKEQVLNPQTEAYVKQIESSIIQYSDNSSITEKNSKTGKSDTSTGFLADTMFTKGPEYLSAAVMYENLVVESNKSFHLPQKIVAIYPKEGTFTSTHPFAILQTPEVTPQKQQAAKRLLKFLLDRQQQQKALQHGFRSSVFPITSPIDENHGVDPSQPIASTLPYPDTGVIEQVISEWENERRNVDVMLLLDHSGSMGMMHKLEKAKEGLIEFINHLGPKDAVGLTVFDTQATVYQPLTQIGPKKGPTYQSLISTIQNIPPASGFTRLYDTLAEQIQATQSFPTTNIKVVIVLTDGEDCAHFDANGNCVPYSQLNHLLSLIKPSGTNVGDSVKVFTIAYGNDARKEPLQAIANTTGGQEYNGTPDTIKKVYDQISEFF